MDGVLLPYVGGWVKGGGGGVSSRLSLKQGVVCIAWRAGVCPGSGSKGRSQRKKAAKLPTLLGLRPPLTQTH